MAGTIQYNIELKSNVAQLLTDMKNVQDRLNTVEGKEYKIKLGIDEKKLERVISNLDKMLESLGKGTGNFQQFENLSKQLSGIVSEVKTLSKAFGNINDSGANELLSSIKNIDQSLSLLKEHITGVNKALSNIGGNTSLFNGEQFDRLLILFEKIESSLSSMKAGFADVGDGKEFSPLLKIIDNTHSSIKELSKTISGIKLDVNMDLGLKNSERMSQKVSQSLNRQLEAYRNLFNGMKSTGKTNKEMLRFFEPDDATVSEIIGAYKGVIKRAEEQFGKDTYKSKIGKDLYADYVKEIRNATDQFNRATNTKTPKNPLGDLFGKNELTEVVSQLGLIVDRLSEISTTVSSLGNVFKNTFKEGFNVSASIEEIEKLTSRVKELESELSKTKLNPIVGNKSNIPAVDNGKSQIDAATASAKELDRVLDQVDIPTKSFDDVLAKLDRTKSELIDIVKITKQSVYSEAEGKFHDSYILKDRRGSTEIYGESSKTDKGQLLRSNIVGYDVKDVRELAQAEAQVTREIEKQNAEQLKRGQVFQQAQQNYLANGAESDAIDRNKKAYQGLTDAIQQYSEVSKRIASGKTLDGDIELASKLESKISELQKQPILSSAQIDESERKLVKLFDTLDTLERKESQRKQVAQGNANAKALEQEYKELQAAENNLQRQRDSFNQRNLNAIDFEIKKREEAARAFSSTLKAQMQERQSQLTSMQAEINNFNANYDRLNVSKPTDENRSADYQQALNNYRVAIDQLVAEQKRLSESKLPTFPEEELNKYKELKSNVEKCGDAFKSMTAAQKGSTEASRAKEFDKISKYLRDNTRLSEEAKQKLQEYMNILRTGGASVNVEEINNKFLKVVATERAAGREGKRFLDIFNTKAVHSLAGQLAYFTSFYRMIGYAKSAINTIKELDEALVDLKKTTTMNASQLENFYFNANDSAKEMGVTTKEIIEQASAWSRLNKIGLLYGDI